MKKVNVDYFKISGKFYTSETFEISEDLQGGTQDYYKALEDNHRIEDMVMVVRDSGDEKEPYIVPHVFKAKFYSGGY